MEHPDSFDSLMTDSFLSEPDIIESAELSDSRKRELLSQRFARTASNGDVNALERLWETCQGSKWVDIDYRDDQGSTPLICAACFGHSQIAELLLSKGASVDSQDNSGWTALMWATSNHDEETVRILLENGASSSAKTAKGYTAINIASSNLGSGSDAESFPRVSESPLAGEAEIGAISVPRREGEQHEHHPAAGSEAGSMHASMGEGDSFLVGSPRSGDHSGAGTPAKRLHGRDSISAGQSVLSMLKASSAKSSKQGSPESSGSANSLGSHGRSNSKAARGRPTSTSPLAAAAIAMPLSDASALEMGDETEPNSRQLSSDEAEDPAAGNLTRRLRSLTMDRSERSDLTASGDAASENGNEDDEGAADGDDDIKDDEPQPFDWDTLQLDQMYVISPATVPQFLHAVVKDIHPERWIQASVLPEHRFVPASMIFLAARFAHHLGTPDFLDSFLADTIASIIHEVQSHKLDPVRLAFWISNIQTLIYFLKRDSTLVQITSDAQGRMSECIQDAYALLIKAVEAEIEPLIDTSLLAYESMPELFADVKFEAEKSQRMSMFFFGSAQPEATRKSTDGRPLRRSQTILSPQKSGRARRGSLLSANKSPTATSPATASGSVPAWIACVERLKSSSSYDESTVNSTKRPSSGDTFVSGRSSHENHRVSMTSPRLFSNPSPRTITYILECLLDLLDMCEIHPIVTWGVMRQMFCYLGGELFNRVLTTRDFCSRSRAMQVRMNLTQINEWVRSVNKRLVAPQVESKSQKDQKLEGEGEGDGATAAAAVETATCAETPAQTAETLLYKAYFDPLIELLELLQCLTHLPDITEYFETTAKMQHLNILQQETAVMNYRYEVQEKRIDSDVVGYLESIAKEIRDGQRADREKQSLERASRRSTASVFSDRRTLDGRPSLFSLDLPSGTVRSSTGGGGGLVRFSADPVAATGMNAADPSGYSERSGNSISRDSSLNISMSRLSSESTNLSPSSNSGMVTMMAPASSATVNNTTHMGSTRGGSRTGGSRTTARRGLLLPIARSSGGSAGAKPSARSLFSGQQQQQQQSQMGGIAMSSGASVANSRLSESLEPISEASSVMSRQRSHTTIDTIDDGSDDGSASLSGRVSADMFITSSAHGHHLHDQVMPNTAPAGSGWGKVGDTEYARGEDFLTASLRGPKGKKCLPENMNELVDSSELLPFAVPTSREWLAWWQSQSQMAKGSFSDGKCNSRDWSNETVALHQHKHAAAHQQQQQSLMCNDAKTSSLKSAHGASAIKPRSELAPVVPSEFLSALSQIA
ncbi:hypothetical protein GGI07_000890 [Coemansia sp. Benny D115]|nr:hypothetical protein GGI07_000890 [Coemansia sp. Benny D115]